jgi:mannitol/fructose-specific phosphotransferase system IIA component (Ntr-type)
METRTLFGGFRRPTRIESTALQPRVWGNKNGGEIVITELLAPELLVTELTANTKDEALEHLARRVAERNRDVDQAQLLSTLHDREQQASTGLGEGVAIPHARLAGLDRMIAAFARSSGGIEWDAADGRPAHLVLLLAGPADQPGTYLKTLAGASRLLRDPQCRARLMSAADAEEMLNVLRNQEGRAAA